MAKRKPYDQRTDLEKIRSQWTKLSGLNSREEWSAAVVRAATAAEIAANLAIRREFASHSQFDEQLVNHFLKWANGLDGKLNKLLLPMLNGQDKRDSIKRLCKLAKTINDKRNSIAHRGEFCGKKDATKLIEKSKEFVLGLVGHYEPDFTLVEKKSPTPSS